MRRSSDISQSNRSPTNSPSSSLNIPKPKNGKSRSFCSGVVGCKPGDLQGAMAAMANSTATTASLGITRRASAMGAAVKEFRIVLMGAAGVGKSSIVKQFLTQKFNSAYVPTVEDCYRHIIQSPDGSCYSVEILDTSGAYSFPAMRELNIRSGSAFILVFSLICSSSIQNLRQIRQEIINIKESEDVPIVLVGNKNDLTIKRKVKPEVAASLAKEFRCRYMETSAKSADNINQLFTMVASNHLHLDHSSTHFINRRKSILPGSSDRLNKKRHSDDSQTRLKVQDQDMSFVKRLSADACRDMQRIGNTDFLPPSSSENTSKSVKIDV